MDSQVYTNEKIDILWEGFRHKIAHMAHPEYVIDTSKWRNFSESMRITWIVSQTDRIEWKDIKYDHLEIRRKSGKITSAIRPHDVSYDHIIAIALVQLKSDIIRSTHKYLHHLSENHKLVKKFATVIGHLYPR
jgi:hypothetical protein